MSKRKTDATQSDAKKSDTKSSASLDESSNSKALGDKPTQKSDALIDAKLSASLAASAADRKRKQRAKQKEMGVKVVEVKLSTTELEALEFACRIRGGVRGAYTFDEYISKLINLDADKLKRDLSQLGKCKHCQCDLPDGCDGVFKGQKECWHTLNYRDLML